MFPAAPGAFGGGGGMTRFVPHLGHTVGAFEDVGGAPRGDVSPGDKAELRGLIGACWGQGGASCRQSNRTSVLCSVRANNILINRPSIQSTIDPSIHQSANQCIHQWRNGEIEPSINAFCQWRNQANNQTITGDPAATSLASRSSDRLVMSASFLSSSSRPLAHSARSCLARQGQRSGAAREYGVSSHNNGSIARFKLLKDSSRQKNHGNRRKNQRNERERVMVYTWRTTTRFEPPCGSPWPRPAPDLPYLRPPLPPLADAQMPRSTP